MILLLVSKKKEIFYPNKTIKRDEPWYIPLYDTTVVATVGTSYVNRRILFYLERTCGELENHFLHDCCSRRTPSSIVMTSLPRPPSIDAKDKRY
jgi:hypothetical protein